MRLAARIKFLVCIVSYSSLTHAWIINAQLICSAFTGPVKTFLRDLAWDSNWIKILTVASNGANGKIIQRYFLHIQSFFWQIGKVRARVSQPTSLHLQQRRQFFTLHGNNYSFLIFHFYNIGTFSPSKRGFIFVVKASLTQSHVNRTKLSDIIKNGEKMRT
jgi:hypothetical protein